MFTAYSYDISRFLIGATIFIALSYFVLSIDDFTIDIAFWLRQIARWRRVRKFPRLTLEQLRAKSERRIAIFVPCWREAEVVGRMVDFACRTLEYGRFDMMIGVYPNDPDTVEAARAAARLYPNVHVVINDRPGPTTKAQNLNMLYAALPEIERDERVDIIVLNDVEDVIHPLSLLIYNYLMPQNEMVQLPVFPLERAATSWTAWTYADEFAENHLKDLVFREASGGFVPSAGVGCAFSRDALEILDVTSRALFPSTSLTEDYVTGLRLRLKGLRTIFVHQMLEVPGMQAKYDTAATWVATRAYFPDTFAAAVRQKTRWVTGICFQAWSSVGWVGTWPTRYALYRDRKSILTNTLALAGYFVLIGSLALYGWHAFDERVALPQVGNNHYVWALLDFVLTITLVRLLEKAYFVSTLYGMRQGLLCLIRPPWASLINGLATIRAAVFVFRATVSGRELTWNKTTHAFPTESALGEFRRQLGSVLVANRKLSAAQLDLALAEQRQSRERLGETLVRMGFVTARDVVEAVGRQTGTATAVDDDLLADPELLDRVPLATARVLCALPLREEDGRVVVAVADPLDAKNTASLAALMAYPVTQRLAEPGRLRYAIERSYAYRDERSVPLGVFLVRRGYLDRATLDQLLERQRRTDKPLLELIAGDDLLAPAQLYDVLQDYFGAAVTTLPPDATPLVDAYSRIPLSLVHEHDVVLTSVAGKPVLAAAFPVSDALVRAYESASGMPLERIVVRRADVERLRALLP